MMERDARKRPCSKVAVDGEVTLNIKLGGRGGGGELVGLDGLFDDCLTNEGRIYIYI